MSADFITSYPSWYIVLCLALALFYAAVLYFRNQIIDPEKNQNWIKYLLAGFRLISVFLIALLLLEPLLLYTRNETEKPVLILAADNSESMRSSKDSAKMSGSLKEAFSTFEQSLSERYEVVQYTFGSAPKAGNLPAFNEKETDISGLLNEVRNAYDGRNIGAIVLATDGIYNKGSNPYYTARELKAPVFSVAYGDTTVRSDFLIAAIRTNTIAYLGNTFPVVIDVTARKCASSPFKIQIYKDGTLLEEQSGQISGNPFSRTFTFMLKANAKGTQGYQVRISRLSGEKTFLNNQKDVFIEVIDGRQKILCLSAVPHPDLAAFRQALEDNQNYELIFKTGEIPSPAECKKYDLVIMHQWFMNAAQKTFAETLKAQKTPALYILGRQSNTSLFNGMVGTVAIRGINGSFNQSTAAMNAQFSLFELSEECLSAIPQFPPLACPFGKYEIPQPERALFTQKIGVVNSKEAMWYLQDDEGYRSGFIAGEGFWKWWLSNFDKFSNHNACKEVMTKTVQYLALKTDKRKFRLGPVQPSFQENEPVAFQAEVYNDNFEPSTREEVSLQLKAANGKVYPFTFSVQGDAYKLNAGILPPGKYTYLAKTKISGKTETIAGNVVVKPLQLESTETVANHSLLKQMAKSTGGKVFAPGNENQLLESLKTLPSAKPVIYTEQTFKDLIHQKWLFFIIVMLIGVEWGVRKWLGSY